MKRRDFLGGVLGGCATAVLTGTTSCAGSPEGSAPYDGEGAQALTDSRNSTDAAPRTGLTIDGNRFLLDGKPFRIISGSIHYFRIHPDQWKDRLNRLRMMGLNAVDVYVPWNFHQPHPNVPPSFTGWCDLPKFLLAAQGLGLHVILRPGPYICAEWDLGGLPAWLLTADRMRLRTSDPRFMAAMDAWFGELLPVVRPLQAKAGGPIVAVQIENEYGSFGDDQTYLQHIRKVLVDGGIDSLLFCSNGTSEAMLKNGNIPGVFATANFAGDPTGPFADLRRFQPSGPLFCTEYWDGWFDHWGEGHHTTDPATTAANVDKMLAMGASVNLYMAAGSTNFGFWAGANHGDSYQSTVTSYDYHSPVGEAGELTEKFTRLRQVIGKYTTLPAGPLPALPPRLAPQTVNVDGMVGLVESFGSLTTPVARTKPVPMEQLGQSYGMIHYRTTLRGPRPSAKLTIRDLGDWAFVYLDGKHVARLDRNTPSIGANITVNGASSQLDLLVDCNGRINFGSRIFDPKGIGGDVLLGNEALTGWEIRPLPLDDLRGLTFRAVGGPAPQGGTFYRARMNITAPADGFLAFPGWGKGLVWLNGFLLGRYWDRGPQRTSYAPAPLWRAGSNTLHLLELHESGTQIELRNKPDLG
ncbi:beta-galactosidase family protein [Pendulispora albinea]|uniref:Beta-galactosidase n=1 Tax=Pendulispora albinea TaxID=2741071 RepID=A0ABZ2M2Q7_9BACT